ncbi:MAG: sigma-70 family RNA polymerase sigma factor [Rhodothermales bacterium]|nr:sigma-70 family RNA polymerase sigma factor [Rhodothermales bacterium]
MPVLSLILALALADGPEVDDVDVARRIREGDRAAFKTFFDRYHGLLYGYLRRRGTEPAVCEDLTQQAFVKIWERRREIQPGKSLRAYLFRIGYNGMLNHIRDTAKFADASDLAERPATADPGRDTEYAIMHEHLVRTVRQLPERRRAVFELCFLQDLTYREAAEALDISVKTVENQMSAALKVLRSAFEHFKDSDRGAHPPDV